MAAERVDVRTAREMQPAGDTIIDVRTSEECVKGHVARAINVPIGNLAVDRLPSGQVLTTCSTPTRGGRAADLLDRGRRWSMRSGLPSAVRSDDVKTRPDAGTTESVE